MAQKIENGSWVWNSEPIVMKAITRCEKPPNFYMNTDGTVSIFSYNVYDIPKSSTALYDLNRNELICFFYMFGLSLIQNYSQSHNEGIEEQLCDICGIVSWFKKKWFFMNICFIVCPLCIKGKEVVNFHVNTRPGSSDTFKSLIEKKIDVAFVSDTNKLVYLWRSTYKRERFLYKSIINERWYTRTDSIKECEWCGRYKKHFNSMCKSCYDFSFDQTFKDLHKCFLIFDNIDNDILNVIITYLLNLLDFNVELLDIVSIRQKDKIR